eukprot:gene3314-4104_t
MESLLATNRQLSLKLEGQQVIDQDTLDRAEKYSAMAAETERLREEVGGDPLCPRTGYALFSALADARLRDSGCQGLRQALEAQSTSLIRLQETDRELRREAQDLHKALEMRKMDLGYLQNEVRDARTRADDRSRALEISEMKVQTLEHK